jgi:hypothetical protein
MMNVHAISPAQSAQGAAAGSAADAALFQSLIAAALLKKGEAALSEAAAQALGLGDAGEAESADLGLLMNLLLGGGVRACEPSADGVETVLPQASLLSAITEAPGEELIAASGAPAVAEALLLLADADAILNAGIAHASIAADASANSAALETLLSNAEAAEMPLSALAGELRTLLAADAARAELPETGKAAERAKALRIEHPQGGEARRAEPAGAETPPDTAQADAAPRAREQRAAAEGEGRASAESAARAEEGAARSLAPAAETAPARDAADRQTEIAAQGPSADTRPAAQEQPAAKAEPYSQVARELFAALAKGTLPTRLSVRLEPAELGKIDVSMRLTSAGKLVIDIAAESARTQALLAGQTDKLVQALGLQNAQVESVNAWAVPWQQNAQGYTDRSMAFFMDLAHGGGPGEGADRDGREPPSQNGQGFAKLAAEEAMPEAVRYARRLDITA